MKLETLVTTTDHEKSHLVTYLNGHTTRATPVPTLYAIRHHSTELESALDTLLKSPEVQEILIKRGEEKEEIHDCLLRIMQRFQEFLMIAARQ